MVRCPEEARLEIVVEDSVTSSEVILRAEDNLDKYQSQDLVEMLKRKMMREVSAQYREQTPSLAELQQKVAAFSKDPRQIADKEGAADPHNAVVQVNTGSHAALRARLADEALSPAVETPKATKTKGKGKGTKQSLESASNSPHFTPPHALAEDGARDVSPKIKRVKRAPVPETSHELEKPPGFADIISHTRASKQEKSVSTLFEGKTTLPKSTFLALQAEQAAKSACASLEIGTL